jgi:hypothetical protein
MFEPARDDRLVVQVGSVLIIDYGGSDRMSKRDHLGPDLSFQSERTNLEDELY